MFLRKITPFLFCLLLVACTNASVSNDDLQKLSFQVFLPDYLPDGFHEQKRILDLKEESLLISYGNGENYIELFQTKKSDYDYHQMIQWFASADSKGVDKEFERVEDYVISMDSSLKKQGVWDVVILPSQDLSGNNIQYNELNYYHVQSNVNNEEELKKFIKSLKKIN